MKEGSFDGLLSQYEFNNDADISRIKTPDQVPEPISFKNVPESVMRSGVIETLMQQNDELLTRLNVALKRIMILDEKLNDANLSAEQMRSKYDNIKDQLLVMREQSRLIAERAQENNHRSRIDENSVNALKAEIKLLEVRYAELYSSSMDRASRLCDENEKLMRRILRFDKYRNSIRRIVPFIKSELSVVKEKRNFYEAQISDLRTTISESTEYITTQGKLHKSELNDLTESYESLLRTKAGEIEKLKTENMTLGSRANEADRFYREKTDIENDLVIAQRREEELRTQTAVEMLDLQKTLARYRNETKELAIKNESQNKQIDELEASKKSLANENQLYTEQVESLQILWREQQVQVEKINEQKNALQKLNQELSIHINQYRREIKELKEKLESTQLKLNSTDNMAAFIASNKAAIAQKANAATIHSITASDEYLSFSENKKSSAGNGSSPQSASHTEQGNSTKASSHSERKEEYISTYVDTKTGATQNSSASAQSEIDNPDDETSILMSKIDKVLSNIHFGQ
jgi:chromosome segregation ATPase